MNRKTKTYEKLRAVLLVPAIMIMLLSFTSSGVEAAKQEDTQSVPPAKKFRYLCDEGKSFTLEFDAEEECVIFTYDGKPLKLPRVVSGSGVKYSNGRTSVWLKGKEAFIEMDGKIIIKSCRSQD